MSSISCTNCTGVVAKLHMYLKKKNNTYRLLTTVRHDYKKKAMIAWISIYMEGLQLDLTCQEKKKFINSKSRSASEVVKRPSSRSRGSDMAFITRTTILLTTHRTWQHIYYLCWRIFTPARYIKFDKHFKS